MTVNLGEVKNLKPGKYVVIDGEPCKISKVEKSKPGKHGGMKARVEGVSLFTGNKKTFVKGVDGGCEIPIIERKSGQVISKLGNDKMQVMELETYAIFEMKIDEEFEDEIEAGKEIEYQQVMGKKMILRVK